MKTILLVTPAFQTRHTIFEAEASAQKDNKMAFMAPIAMATVAALTPPDKFKVDLWDENVSGPIHAGTALPSPHYDLVGVTSFSIQFGRVEALSKLFRSRGAIVVLGGPAASTTPECYIHLGDVIFIGEAEYTWPAFLQDWENGAYRKLYRQVIKPELAVSPPPKWELVAGEMDRYFAGAVQTSRGCPYDCEFCDVPYIFGHRSRWKPVPEVLKEIEMMQQLGVRRVFFCDDNFIGDLRYARSLLKELAALNNKFPRPLLFFTQLTLNVAKHDDILEMMADANFSGLFIGIETPNKESLKGAKKLQNCYTDIVADVHKVQSYGMTLWSGIIVGFDFDTTDIFDQQFEFLQAAGVTLPQIQLLYGPPGTRLWYRLQKEGRLLEADEQPTLPHTTTNIIPAAMTRLELFKGHLDLHQRLRDWDNFAVRAKLVIDCIRRQPKIDFIEKRAIARKGKEKAGRVLVSALRSPIGDVFLAGVRQVAKLLPKFPGLGIMALEKQARRAILDIIADTLDKAPFMFPEKIMPIIIMQVRQIELLRKAMPDMVKQIELESQPGFQVQYAANNIVISEAFAEEYKGLFPEIFTRVSTELKDQSKSEEVLIEIFTDFLSHWTGPLETLEAHHKADLKATCDAVLARENKMGVSALIKLGAAPTGDFRKSKLPEEILHSVEQELRMRPNTELVAS